MKPKHKSPPNQAWRRGIKQETGETESRAHGPCRRRRSAPRRWTPTRSSPPCRPAPLLEASPPPPPPPLPPTSPLLSLSLSSLPKFLAYICSRIYTTARGERERGEGGLAWLAQNERKPPTAVSSPEVTRIWREREERRGRVDCLFHGIHPLKVGPTCQWPSSSRVWPVVCGVSVFALVTAWADRRLLRAPNGLTPRGRH